jgi:hypothetical protein
MRFIKLRPYYEINMASRTSRTPARHGNPTVTAQAHASGSQGSSWADNLLGFWSGGHNQTQCNSLESEVEAYLLDSRTGVNSITFWQVSDSDLMIIHTDSILGEPAAISNSILCRNGHITHSSLRSPMRASFLFSQGNHDFTKKQDWT